MECLHHGVQVGSNKRRTAMMGALALVLAVFLVYGVLKLQKLPHFNTSVNDAASVFAGLTPDETRWLGYMGAAVLLYLVILAWRAVLASRRGEEIEIQKEAYNQLQEEAEALRESKKQLEVAVRQAKEVDAFGDFVAQLRNVSRFSPADHNTGSYEEETLEDAIARLERTASDLGRSVITLQGRADGTVQESRIRSLSERLREIHAQALALSNRNSAMETLLLEADSLKERIEQQMEEADHEDIVDKVQELDKFAFDQTTSLQQIERASDQLELVLERLHKLDAEAASMLTGDGSVVEQLRLAERLVALVKARIEPLQASQNGNRADIGARIVKAGQETASLETSLDRLDLATGLKQIEALSTRLAALHVQLTGQQPKLTVVGTNKMGEPATAAA